MSRLHTRNSRGRQPMLGSAPKFSKSKERPNDTYQLPNGKKSKNHLKQRTVASKAAARRRRAESTSSEDLSSSFGSDTADDASDEDSDDDEADEDDLPAVQAPSRSQSLNGAGRKIRSMSRGGFSVAGSTDSMFGDYGAMYEDVDDNPNISPEENRKLFENQIFADLDDDNDDVYQAVDDISDSEDELDDRRIEEQELLAMLSEEDNSDADLLLNQIDGLSAYGFGDDSDATIYRFPSSQGSDSGADAAPERRVHFAVDSDRSIFLAMSESPTITRALLPSARPEAVYSTPIVDKRSAGMVDDLDDSDLTDDCLPEEALQSTPTTTQVQRESSPSVSPPTKKSPQRRGPPRGIFIDEGTKASGILDPSGKIILLTNPHLLGEEFARRYGASETSSPDLGFAELIEDSDGGEREPGDLVGVPGADIMLASLNSAISDPSNLGQAVGPLEAFYPSNSLLFGDFAIDPDELEENFRPDEDTGEDVINLTDVIKFDEDTDDSEAPTSPFFMPPSRELSGLGNVNNEFAYLNNNNVTAFRRNADPAFAALNNTPSFREMDLFSSPFATPAPRRKRKVHASPYTSSHYKGVTPVQRMRAPNHPQTPDASTPAKRRRIMT
ncbi:hypothetical protein A1O1_04727 [Capronia coronata CBS 617.96]|uniref:Uncharacterized protein n=1 Tax=Capronia coronata CBS 617.96 TaxID=1182541 RepID=W9YDP2_9EURO|nr:uncharacterized protein A1O1_04727 [Capronia coronata CBS 617.96]EXJ87800.1 hypothetical protein A1O1_04727 [Capronia coronata CBS 617.96]